MEKVRFGLIGCGGRMNCHLQGLEALDNIEVVAVADPIPERAEAAAKRMGAKRIYKKNCTSSPTQNVREHRQPLCHKFL